MTLRQPTCTLQITFWEKVITMYEMLDYTLLPCTTYNVCKCYVIHVIECFVLGSARWNVSILKRYCTIEYCLVYSSFMTETESAPGLAGCVQRGDEEGTVVLTKD